MTPQQEIGRVAIVVVVAGAGYLVNAEPVFILGMLAGFCVLWWCEHIEAAEATK